MIVSRTARIAAAVGLAVLAGFFVAGQVHAQADIVAGDTTWSAPADTAPALPDDTTWSVPADGGTVPIAPRDTTWGW
ncbi:hypothetical protein ABZV67_21780 [Streptomyces sp. NPDC005065]|uniref:hypothetical protein n=1 Tax=Streptomyces sp. NPDC005065 TaxID=3154461 RepID=UPI0033BC5631